MKKGIKKNNSKKYFNWYLLFIISLTSIITGIYRDGFAALFPFLQKEFGLTRAQLGLHSTFFYFTCALFAAYTGRLVDIKGSKWSLVFSSIVMGIFYFIHSIAPNFIIILLIAALTGVSVSFNLPTVNKCIVEWFPQKQRSTALGLQSMAFPMGGLIGAIALPFFGSILGWRKTMLIPALMAILCALFLLYFYQERKKAGNYPLRGSEKDKIPSFWRSVSQLIKNRELVKVSVLGFFLGVMGNSVNAHFTLFLFLDYGFPESVAGLGFAFVQMGSVLGRVAWGLFCDKVMGSDKRKTFLAMGLSFWFITIILSVGLRSLNPSVSILFLLAFFVGCFGNGYSGVLNAAVTETVREENVGIAIGFSSIFMRSGLMIAPPLFGYIADIRGSYNLSWLLLGIIMLFASLGQYVFSQKNGNEGKLFHI